MPFVPLGAFSRGGALPGHDPSQGVLPWILGWQGVFWPRCCRVGGRFRGPGGGHSLREASHVVPRPDRGSWPGYGKNRSPGRRSRQRTAQYSVGEAEKPSKFLFFDEVGAIDGAKLAEAQKATDRTPAQKAIADASITGDRKTLKADSFIPAAMAAIYLLLLLYFKAIGGYKPIHIDEQKQ